MPVLTLSGTFSSMSARFAAGARIVLMPARCAARIFSLSPPTGSTCPTSEISPVIAMSGLIGVLVNSETNAESSAVPALGPSFPMLPSGMWTCTSQSFRIIADGSSVTPSAYACAFVQLSAICALSRMTSPSLPVSCRPPLPGIIYEYHSCLRAGKRHERGAGTHGCFDRHNGTRAIPEVAQACADACGRRAHVHSVFMVDGRADIIFQVFWGDANVYGVRHLERFGLFRGHFSLGARCLGGDARSGSSRCSGFIRGGILRWDGLVSGTG